MENRQLLHYGIKDKQNENRDTHSNILQVKGTE